MNAATGFGTVVMAGRTFQIMDLRLANGVINVEFHVEGPTPQLEGSPTVFGEDGQGCWQFTPQTVRALGEGEFARVHITLRVGSVVREQEPAGC